MKTRVDSRLAREAVRFDLRFACEDCVHFSGERERTCGHGWPIRVRRDALALAPAPETSCEFCKEFELG
jgi:hypothetical protein